MEMEEESSGEDPSAAALMHLHRQHPIPPPFGGLLMEEEDENGFVDLQELSTLSDGDLCMSRQLAAALAADPRNAGCGRQLELLLLEKTAECAPPTAQATPLPIVVDSAVGKGLQQEDECTLAELDAVQGDFLPTEAVEQFLQGMDQEAEMAVDSVRTAENGAAAQHQQRQKQQRHASKTTAESRADSLASPVPEFTAPPPPPIVISPQEVCDISITLEKNQQCACKDCGKLFNSVWYLKQHAVKHSNDRPFKCRFCMKTYKFRSNLYQHKCPERNRLLVSGEFSLVGHPYRRRAYNRSADKKAQSSNSNHHNNNNNVECPAGGGGSGAAISINTAVANNGMADCFSPDGTFSEPNGGAGLLMMGGTTGIGSGTGEEQAQRQGQMFGLNSEDQLPLVAPFPQGTSAPIQTDAHQFPNNTAPFQQPQVQSKAGLPRTLPVALIEQYMRRNRHRVFNCRKCKLFFPSREYFSRHIAYHNELEEHKHCCEKCPERFQSEAALQAHLLQHSDQSPHCCASCSGVFRSALALRRHKDNWRQCHSPAFGFQQFSLAVNPIDQYSFVESDLDELGSGRSDEEVEEEEEEYDEEEEEERVLLENADEEPHLFCANSSSSIVVPFGGDGKALQRKTTRDSGYQGSDTSPAGSHSPDEERQHSSGGQGEQQGGRLTAPSPGGGQRKKSGRASAAAQRQQQHQTAQSGARTAADKNNNTSGQQRC